MTINRRIAEDARPETKYRLLGSLEVGRVARLGGPRQRAVLAALMLRANATASIGYLTRAAWDDPPAAPESNLRTYVAGLRRMLREAGEDDACLLTRPTGYSLVVQPGELDMTTFEQFAERGGEALRQSDYATAAGHFRSALSLWRGQPLEGQAVGPALQADVGRLQDRRFAVIGQHCQASLALGNHAGLAGDILTWARITYLPEDLNNKLSQGITNTDVYAEAMRAWSDCMELQGYDYDLPAKAEEDLAARYKKEGVTTELRRQEIAVAVADAECAQEAEIPQLVLRLKKSNVKTLSEAEQKSLRELADRWLQAATVAQTVTASR